MNTDRWEVARQYVAASKRVDETHPEFERIKNEHDYATSQCAKIAGRLKDLRKRDGEGWVMAVDDAVVSVNIHGISVLYPEKEPTDD